mmetsp:Transcript_219/g.333  ORF Transcript_219/g.333 Transcript_219/m.333 type:complete len:125 (+) Transcript_219:144-518(+)
MLSQILFLSICSIILFMDVSAFAPTNKLISRQNIFQLQFAEESSSSYDESEDLTPPKPEVKCPNCDKCDGSGRILGGIPTILPWWPIKPYRPCPNFIANGGQYIRSGQPLDEIAFGRVGKDEDF